MKTLSVPLTVAALASGILLFAGPETVDRHKPSLQLVRVEHIPAPILSLDLAPDSDLAAAAMSDGRVRLWHLDSGKIVREFDFPEPETDPRQKSQSEVEPIRTRFSPDGKTFAVSFLSRIHLYDAHNWAELMVLGIEGEDVMRPIPRPQLGTRPYAEKEADDLNTGTQKWIQRKMLGDGRTRITDFAYTPDGMAIVASYTHSGYYDVPAGTRFEFSSGYDPVRFWELESGRMVWEKYSPPNRLIERVVISPRGNFLLEVTSGAGWVLQLRDLADYRELASVKLFALPHDPPDVAFIDNQHFVTLWQEPGQLWQMALLNASNGKAIGYFIDHAGAQRFASSPNGMFLAATTWVGVGFKVWDTQKLKPLLTIKLNLSGTRVRPLDSIRFTSNGHGIVVTSQRNGLVFTYEMTPGL